MQFLKDVDLGLPDKAILDIEEKIKRESLKNSLGYDIVRKIYWKPVSDAILDMINTSPTSAQAYISRIDKYMATNEAYNKSNLLMEIVLEGVITDNKMFAYPKYVAAATIYSPTDKHTGKPSADAISEIIMDTIEDSVEERKIVKQTLELLNEKEKERKDFSIPHTLFGLGNLFINKHLGIVSFEILKEQIAKLLNVNLSEATNMDQLANIGKIIIQVIYTSYNLSTYASVIKYHATRASDIDKLSSAVITLDTLEKAKPLEFPPEGAKVPKHDVPFDKYGSGDRMILILDYEYGTDRFAILGEKDEEQWNPILDAKASFKVEKDSSIKIWSIAKEIIEITKHNNFIRPALPIKEIVEFSNITSVFKEKFPTYNHERDEAKAREFFKEYINWKALPVLMKAKMNIQLNKLMDILYIESGEEVKPFSAFSSSASEIVKYTEAAGI